jgi:hypothetical protein
MLYKQTKILFANLLLLGCLEYSFGNPLTRGELETMIKAGEDITEADVSEITDMSGLFYQDIFSWNIRHFTDRNN